MAATKSGKVVELVKDHAREVLNHSVDMYALERGLGRGRCRKGNVRVLARVWLRVARRPLRLTVPLLRARVTQGEPVICDGVVQLRLVVRRVWRGFALLRVLEFACRLGVAVVDATEVA